MPAPTVLLTGLCALIYLLDGLIHSLLGPLAPDMAASLHLGNAQLGPIFSANLAGQCLGLVLLPLLADRLRQRGVVLLSLAGFGLAQAAPAGGVGGGGDGEGGEGQGGGEGDGPGGGLC